MRGRVKIGGGKVLRVSGRLPHAVIDELTDEARRSPSEAATIDLRVEDGRWRLTCKGGSEGFAQRCRNRIALRPPPVGVSAGTSTRPVALWVIVTVVLFVFPVLYRVFFASRSDLGWQPLESMSESEAEAFAAAALEEDAFAEARARLDLLSPTFERLEVARLIASDDSSIQDMMRTMPPEVPLFFGPRALVARAERDRDVDAPALAEEWVSRLAHSGVAAATVQPCGDQTCVVARDTRVPLPRARENGDAEEPCNGLSGVAEAMEALETLGASSSPPRHVRFFVVEMEDLPPAPSAFLLLSDEEAGWIAEWVRGMDSGDEAPFMNLTEVRELCGTPAR